MATELVLLSLNWLGMFVAAIIYIAFSLGARASRFAGPPTPPLLAFFMYSFMFLDCFLLVLVLGPIVITGPLKIDWAAPGGIAIATSAF